VSDWDGYKSIVKPAFGIRVPTYVSNIIWDDYFNICSRSEFGDRAIQSVAVDFEEICKSISKLLRSESTRQKMAMSALKASQGFSEDKMMSRLHSLLKDHIGQYTGKKIKFPASLFPSISAHLTHFATAVIKPKDVFILTSFGRYIAADEEPLFILTNHIAQYDLGPAITDYLAHTPSSATSLAKAFGQTERKMMETLMFLMKHGVVCLLTPPA
jgi:hypothetical protein